ncbi:unnamed protein product [Calicophoron daubneyi]|uniref:peptidylprolyl isomerase n=1 Tax=Calicophoron daubneyi TaxID=300641 RepID=A0AAV2TU92_CALDB
MGRNRKRTSRPGNPTKLKEQPFTSENIDKNENSSEGKEADTDGDKDDTPVTSTQTTNATDSVMGSVPDSQIDSDDAKQNQPKRPAEVKIENSADGQEPAEDSSDPFDNQDVVDILGNGLITKKVIDRGLGRETRPNHGDLVTVSYKGWLEDGTLVDDVSDVTLTLGDGDVIHALDLALPLAELKESFELIVDPRFAYGSRGREPDIPGNAKLRYQVHLQSSDDPPSYQTMTNSDRFAIADQKRERGNYYYRREEYAFAVNSYNKALKILCPADDMAQPTGKGDEPPGSHVSSKDMLGLEIKLQNNLAATQLKIEAYDAAIKSCDAVLRKDPHNFKALFRKGRALLGLSDIDEAIPILKRVLELVPNSPMVASELQRARLMQQKERERWSRAATRMFPHRGKGSEKTNSKSSWLRPRVTLFRCLVFGAFVAVLVSVVLVWYPQHLPGQISANSST